MLGAIKRLFNNEKAGMLVRAGDMEIIPPEERLKHVEQNIRAMTSMLDTSVAGQLIVLQDTVSMGGVLTDVEIRADKIHLTNSQTKQSKLVRLDDSLDAYNLLEEELRCQLAQKIARLVPDLAHSKKKLVLDHTVQVLQVIAKDQTERVRMMVAEELADVPNAPYDVVQKLAWDPSYRVACPILEFSPLLKDHELIEIIGSSNVPGVAEAIARRANLSESVSSAVVKTGQEIAIHQLLKNDGASINEKSMNQIIAMAPEHEVWHGALVSRPELTQKTVNRIAGFISQNLLLELEQQGQLPTTQKQQTRKAVQTRLTSWSEEQQRQAELRVRQLDSVGRLSDEVIDDAIHALNTPFVAAALAARTRMPLDMIRRVLKSDSARAITALAWEAGLPMRSAMDLQMKIGNIHHSKMLNARGGTDYPITQEEADLYLGIFFS